MQSLQDLHLFDDDQNFQKQKEESINELIKDPYIMKVLSDGQVGRDFIEENWVEFLDFQEDVQKCKDCMGLYQCHKVSKGMKQAVHVENHHLKTILVPCKYGKEILEKQNILSHITVSNVSDDLLLSDLKSIKCPKRIKCPVLEIGKNSVKPSIKPKNKALSSARLSINRCSKELKFSIFLSYFSLFINERS